MKSALAVIELVVVVVHNKKRNSGVYAVAVVVVCSIATFDRQDRFQNKTSKQDFLRKFCFRTCGAVGGGSEMGSGIWGETESGRDRGG